MTENPHAHPHAQPASAESSIESQIELHALATEVRAGLTARPKRLPCHLLYDARGSALFEAITELPEYYLTRTELGIFRECAGEIARRAGPPRSVIELGAGTGAKTRTLLDAVVQARRTAGARTPAAYYPIDVSKSALEIAARSLAHPGLLISPLVGRYQERLPAVPALPSPRLMLFIGSSIGNYEPPAAGRLLAQVHAALGKGDSLLLGADLRKPAHILLPAYDDAAGVTARFSKNVLARINRQLGADFDLDSFRHVALWNPAESRMEMYLESACDQRARVPALGLTVEFTRGERLHTENSYKLTRKAQLDLLIGAGFTPEATWLDPDSLYAVHLARA